MDAFQACPTCRQYSHSIGEDQLAEAFMHFQSMFSHRGDGIPTQHSFDAKTRDMAQVLMAGANGLIAIDFRAIAFEQIQRQRRTGESGEMLARWISEAVRAALRARSDHGCSHLVGE
jgi:hypothetical protein